MNDVFLYFSAMPTLHKLIWLFGCLSLATLAEFIIPLRKHTNDRATHFRTNGGLLVSTMLINSLFTAIVLLASAYTNQHHFGLLTLISLPAWVEFLIALAIMDLFAQYTIHYLLHHIPFLWRFHKIHHSDTHVDATTGTRHHPVDYLCREVFSLTIVVLLGMPPEFYALYRVITVFCTYFTHANIQLPKTLDRIVSMVIVSPDAHKFHHHDKALWTDRNFGNILSIWDRLFGTFVYADTDKIHFGVDTMDASKSNNLVHQLSVPFQSGSVDPEQR